MRSKSYEMSADVLEIEGIKSEAEIESIILGDIENEQSENIEALIRNFGADVAKESRKSLFRLYGTKSYLKSKVEDTLHILSESKDKKVRAIAIDVLLDIKKRKQNGKSNA